MGLELGAGNGAGKGLETIGEGEKEKGRAQGPGGHGVGLRDQGGHEAGERFNSLANPFAPPDSCKAALCPQPQPHTVYS